MNIAELEADLFQKNVNFVHLAPNARMCKRAESNFFDTLAARGVPLLPETQWRARFIACTLQGVSVDHVPVLVLQDPDMMDKRALAEAMAIPAPEDGHQPMVIRVW